MTSEKPVFYSLFVLFLVLNIAFWFYSRDLRSSWSNVPPAPSEKGTLSLALGDKQFAYNSLALMLQNLGDVGGRMNRLEDYDYKALGEWLLLSHKLDPHSNVVPLLASFYYGSTENSDDLDSVINYLAYQTNLK